MYLSFRNLVWLIVLGSAAIGTWYLSREPGEDPEARIPGYDLQGEIHRELPPDRPRLFDYLNLSGERFLQIDCSDGRTYLINKLYIMCVTP